MKKSDFKATDYLWSMILTGLAFSLQWALVKGANVIAPGLLYPSTFLIAWYFGFGPALLAVILGIGALAFFIYEPAYSFTMNDVDDIIRLAIFGIASLLAGWIVSRSKESQTKELQTKNELRSLETRFKRSSSATNLGVWYCDLPFDVLAWSKETKEHFWLPENAHVTIETFYERIHPNDREKTKTAINHAIQNHSSYDIVYRTTNPQNISQIKYIRAIGWTDYDENGNPVRFDGITLDNTVLTTLNEMGKLISEELDQHKLVEKATDAATRVIGAEFGAFFYNVINDKGESYTLYTVSGVPREMFSKFPMPRNTEVFAPTFKGERIMRSDDITKDPRYGKNWPYNGMPEGHLPVVSYLAVPVISRSGQVIGGMFFGHKKPAVFDEKAEQIIAGLASQVAVAMDNARLFDQANKAIQIRDEFLSISSHELRTPLTPLKLQIQSLKKFVEKGIDQIPEGRLEKIAYTADKQVSRLISLVDDLLDVSRISSGKLTLNREPVELNFVIREIVERFSSQLSDAQCEVKLNLAPSLEISADRLRIEQVLINLLTNAIKYAPNAPVEIELLQIGEDAIIKIKDNGKGISEKDLHRIFDRFERVNNDVSQTGLGLGLYIVHQIVTAHGGTVSVQSEESKGTLFTISLPKG